MTRLAEIKKRLMNFDLLPDGNAEVASDVEWLIEQNTRLREALERITTWRELMESGNYYQEPETTARKALGEEST